MIRNTTRNVALALMSAAVLSACATGGSYVQSDQYGNPTEQQNRTGRNALIDLRPSIPMPQQKCLAAYLRNLAGDSRHMGLLHHQHQVSRRQHRRCRQTPSMGAGIMPLLPKQLPRGLIYRPTDQCLKPCGGDLHPGAIPKLVPHENFCGWASTDVSDADQQHLVEHEPILWRAT